MSSFRIMAVGKNVSIGIMVMQEYPVMCAACCPWHEKNKAYCALFSKELIKVESRYVRAGDCIRGRGGIEMIDISIGKALVPVESESCMENGICSKECIFGGFENCDATCLDCAGYTREDGKNVIFKLVDWSAKEER